MSKQAKKEEQEEQEKIWLEIFTLFDKDKNGHVCKNELGCVLRALDLDPTRQELEDAMRELDRDGNGNISFCDFKAYMHTKKQCSVDERKEELMTAFRIIDKNGDKYLDASELIKLLTSLGDTLSKEEAEAMIRVADVNKDGKIDYEEFVEFILSPYLSSNCSQTQMPLRKQKPRTEKKDINCNPTSVSQQSMGFSYSGENNSSSSNFYVRGNSSSSDVSMTNVGEPSHKNIIVHDTSLDSDLS